MAKGRELDNPIITSWEYRGLSCTVAYPKARENGLFRCICVSIRIPNNPLGDDVSFPRGGPFNLGPLRDVDINGGIDWGFVGPDNELVVGWDYAHGWNYDEVTPEAATRDAERGVDQILRIIEQRGEAASD